MKLKYYLRGLGIGIMVTTLILTLSSGVKKTEMTDAEIKERASELGMVDEKSMLLSEAEKLADGSESDDRISSAASGNAVSSDRAVSSDGTISSDKILSANAAISGNILSTDTVPYKDTVSESSAGPGSNTADNKVSGDPGDDISASENTTAEKGVPLIITINIDRGESSTSVAKKLKAAGLIGDSAGFDAYLCEKGYDRRLVTGKHMIPQNATQLEIAKLITKAQ